MGASCGCSAGSSADGGTASVDEIWSRWFDGVDAGIRRGQAPYTDSYPYFLGNIVNSARGVAVCRAISADAYRAAETDADRRWLREEAARSVGFLRQGKSRPQATGGHRQDNILPERSSLLRKGRSGRS